MTTDDAGAGTDPDHDAGSDPEVSLAAVVRGETRVRWTGVLVFVPGRVVMGCLGILVLAYHGVAGLLGTDPTMGAASRSVPEGATVYPVAAGAVLWFAGAGWTLAAGPVPPALAAVTAGWIGTTLAVAVDVRASGYPVPGLDRAAYLLAVAVPVLSGPAGAAYLAGRMRRASRDG